MRTSSNTAFAHSTLRNAAWWAVQIVAGLAAATIAILLPPFRVDLCDPAWRAGPIALLAIAALLIVPMAAFSRARLALGAFVLGIAGWAAWLLYLGNALGCE
jgi:hypothetical protein